VIQSKKNTKLATFNGVLNLKKLLEVYRMKKALDPD